jgi:hypothetical protein
MRRIGAFATFKPTCSAAINQETCQTIEEAYLRRFVLSFRDVPIADNSVQLRKYSTRTEILTIDKRHTYDVVYRINREEP